MLSSFDRHGFTLYIHLYFNLLSDYFFSVNVKDISNDELRCLLYLI